MISIYQPKSWWLCLSLGCLVAVGSAGAHEPDADEVEDLSADDASGAFTCDFTIPSSFPLNQVGPLIERDRMYMSARPGMVHKHIPLRFTPTGDLLTGGRYLFDTARHAREYHHWVDNDFILDGVLFFNRPYFLNPECHDWSVIGAHDFGNIHASQVVMRTERWTVPQHSQRRALNEKFEAVLAEAKNRHLTSVWLLYNRRERLVSLVYFANRVVQPNPSVPDFASLSALESSTPLGHLFDSEPWTRVFDRTQWTLTIWFPFVLGDQGEPALWVNSPPLASPFPGDGVCEVSRGEDFLNSPADCLATCGNGVPDLGENSMNCPGDVRLFP